VPRLAEEEAGDGSLGESLRQLARFLRHPRRPRPAARRVTRFPGRSRADESGEPQGRAHGDRRQGRPAPSPPRRGGRDPRRRGRRSTGRLAQPEGGDAGRQSRTTRTPRTARGDREPRLGGDDEQEGVADQRQVRSAGERIARGPPLRPARPSRSPLHPEVAGEAQDSEAGDQESAGTRLARAAPSPTRRRSGARRGPSRRGRERPAQGPASRKSRRSKSPGGAPGPRGGLGERAGGEEEEEAERERRRNAPLPAGGRRRWSRRARSGTPR